MTHVSIRDDPANLSEPLIQTQTWVWNPFQAFGGYKCDAVPEIPGRVGDVPHHLPGENTLIPEFSDLYGVPLDAARGGAETMYPEYTKKLKTMKIPRPKVFERVASGAQK